ncbi:hypothetical protein [Halorubellus sp. PRR65]|uniref:DUF7285 family protein n=1 Tax=Halorubellus sp. PRR65 TaxID=3098148 RepID=UPI002B25B953|nr:hypothetical protein [Halorubellus sp. PRR65]
MSRSSSPEPADRTQRSADARGQTGPLPALAATVVVGAALALYASSLYGAFPDPADPRVAEPTLQRTVDALATDGVVRPDDLADARSTAPDGYEAAFVLATNDDRWRVGPASPPDAASATRPIAVRVAPGVVVTGRLRVVVWR